MVRGSAALALAFLAVTACTASPRAPKPGPGSTAPIDGAPKVGGALEGPEWAAPRPPDVQGTADLGPSLAERTPATTADVALCPTDAAVDGAAPPPEPWEGPDCAPVAGSDPYTVLCRDEATASAHAAAEGEPTPPRAPAPEGMADPTVPVEGLALYRDIRSRIAPQAKLTPVVFHETPPFSDEQWALFRANPKAWELARRYWADPRAQYRHFKELWRTLRKDDKPLLRAILLRSGYVFTADRQVARQMYRAIRLPGLFDEETVYVQRGDEVFRLKPDKRKGYVYADGPLAGRMARFYLFDRLATAPDAFAPTWHWDVSAIRRGLGLRRIRFDSARGPTVPFTSTLVTGEPVAGILFHREGRTAVALAGVTPTRWESLLGDAHRRLLAKQKIIDAAEQFVDEWIKFDEPDLEFGQEDGVLRQAWIEAYEDGRDDYEYNGTKYKVFGANGLPIPPQVCVDFLMDSVERASGRWWLPRTKDRKERRRTPGTIDWKSFDGLRPRSVPSVIKFAKRHPEIFEVFAIPEKRQVKFEDQNAFYRNIETLPEEFREADIIVIWGYREDQQRHFHSFFVHTVDPIDGFPLALADNAGLAAVRVWHDVMRTAPQRYLYYHLRIRDEWLLANGL